jgi:hypothetical protein
VYQPRTVASIRSVLVVQQFDSAEDPFASTLRASAIYQHDVCPKVELCHYTNQESNMEIDLTSWSSIPMDSLISPAWAPEKMLGKGLWEGPSDGRPNREAHRDSFDAIDFNVTDALTVSWVAAACRRRCGGDDDGELKHPSRHALLQQRQPLSARWA